MIFEYALSPKLVVDWAISGQGQYVPMFGMDARRLVSDFPRDWKGAVYDDALSRFGYDYEGLEFQNVMPTLDAFLQLLTDYMVPRGGKLNEGEEWIEGTIREHKRNDFQAIVTTAKPTSFEAPLLTPSDFNDIRNELWWLPSVQPTEKTATAIANCLTPLLKRASRIIVVDPYIALDKQRYKNTISELIKVAFDGRHGSFAMPELHIIAGLEQYFRPQDLRDADMEKRVARNILARCLEVMPRLMPKSCCAHLIVLKEKSGGNALHNRSVLTNIGGAILPYGIDEVGVERDRQVDDDIQPMSKAIYERRWRQYATLKEFDTVLGATRIDGIA